MERVEGRLRFGQAVRLEDKSERIGAHSPRLLKLLELLHLLPHGRWLSVVHFGCWKFDDRKVPPAFGDGGIDEDAGMVACVRELGERLVEEVEFTAEMEIQLPHHLEGKETSGLDEKAFQVICVCTRDTENQRTTPTAVSR